MDFLLHVLLLSWHNVEMRNFCLLTSRELILVSNCSLLYLHSNDINRLKRFLEEKKVIAMNMIVIKKNTESVYNLII